MCRRAGAAPISPGAAYSASGKFALAVGHGDQRVREPQPNEAAAPAPPALKRCPFACWSLLAAPAINHPRGRGTAEALLPLGSAVASVQPPLAARAPPRDYQVRHPRPAAPPGRPQAPRPTAAAHPLTRRAAVAACRQSSCTCIGSIAPVAFNCRQDVQPRDDVVSAACAPPLPAAAAARLSSCQLPLLNPPPLLPRLPALQDGTGDDGQDDAGAGVPRH